VTRSASEAGLDALPFIVWRAAIATVAMLPIIWFWGSRTGQRSRFSDLPPNRGRALIVIAIIGGLLNIAMFQAFLLTTIAVVLICFYCFPALVTIAAVPLYGERIDRVRGGALILSGIGLVLVVLAPLFGSSDVTINPVGIALAFGAAICQATFILIVGRGFAPLPPPTVSAFVLAAAGVVAVILAFFFGDTAGLFAPFSDANLWPWILYAGILGAAIPTTAFITGIGIIGPSRAAIMMTVEPLVGVILAALLLGERPAPIQIVGGAAVLVAAAILQVAPRTAPIPAEPEFGPLV